jgi:acyl dehydratase
MLNSKIEQNLAHLLPGSDIGPSPWVTVTQDMIDRFGDVTLDPDPMHIDPSWARQNGPFGGTIAFGFLTVSLLTHLLQQAFQGDLSRDPKHAGYYLNYGFNRLRLVTPVKTGSRVRGVFRVLDRTRDERQRLLTCFDCRIEIDGEPRPALVAHWLTIWVPPEA